MLHPKDHEVSLLRRCVTAALLSGVPVFGIRNNSVCVGSVHAALIYMRYGPSTKCYNGTGAQAQWTCMAWTVKTFQSKWLDKSEIKYPSQNFRRYRTKINQLYQLHLT